MEADTTPIKQIRNVFPCLHLKMTFTDFFFIIVFSCMQSYYNCHNLTSGTHLLKQCIIQQPSVNMQFRSGKDAHRDK